MDSYESDNDDNASSEVSILQSDDETYDWKRGLPLPGEFLGEQKLPVEEDLVVTQIDKYDSPEESEKKLELAKDPKLIMMEEVKKILYNLITDRPENVIDYFEEYVRFITTKEEKIKPMVNIFASYFKVNKFIDETIKWIKWRDEQPPELEGEGAKIKREYNYLNKMNNFEDGGITLTKLEMFSIVFALNDLTQFYELENIKFWGKIFGLYNNYYIMEADVTRAILEKDREEENAKKLDAAEDVEEPRLAEEEEEEYNLAIKWNMIKTLAQYIKPPLPKSTYKKPKFAPKEKLGTGVNRKIYYVSNKPAEGYIKLPEVTPVQIVKARQIKYLFTGILDQEIFSDPPFPGNESNYLRAQIARISAGTQLSPLGYYSFDLGEGGFEEEEEEGNEEFKMKIPKPNFAPNPDFEPLPLPDLVDPAMSFWVHHMAHILPQGRAIWVDPTIDPNAPKPEGEDLIVKDKPIPEIGPPLLTVASEDMSLEMIPPWSTRLALDLAPNYGGVIVRSNLWLGAFTYALHNEIDFENIYIGWGFKHNASSFSPTPYFIPQKEYEIGPEVTEITDPNPEEEDYEEILYREQKEEEKRKKMEEE